MSEVDHKDIEIYTATILLKNTTNSRVLAQLYHRNPVTGTQSSGTIIEKNTTSEAALVVSFSSAKRNHDAWFLVLHRVNGSSVGTYVTGGDGSTISDPTWSPWSFTSGDAGKTFTFTISGTELKFPKRNGTSNVVPLSYLRAFQPIQNVFVVMLENHSFDNMLAFSGIPGITKRARTSSSNTYTGTGGAQVTVNVSKGAPPAMPVDPGHEFEDVLTQLCGAGATYTAGGAYPPVNSTGYAADYAEVLESLDPTQVQEVMQCFDTASQLPVLYDLATNFTLCQRWYSSVPGPTWPNRLFVHCASSGGLDDSPGLWHMLDWGFDGGVRPPNGTIFEKIKAKNWSGSTERLTYRFYQDSESKLETIAAEVGAAIGLGLTFASYKLVMAANFIIPTESLYAANPKESLGAAGFGWFPVSYGLRGIHASQFRSMTQFARDLSLPFNPCYTHIEPHYGNILMKNLRGGSSQHPQDDTYGGEGLLKAIYEGLRNSPIWYTSMLIVVYDEGGGFYDCANPSSAPAPGDGKNGTENGFTFQQYGPRVPAIVISPLVSAVVTDNKYDHASVPKTLENLFGLTPLTQRDSKANGLDDLCTLSLADGTYRTDCPTTLSNPVPPQVKREPLTEEEYTAMLAEPLPERGNLIGILGGVLRYDLSENEGTGVPVSERLAAFSALKTRGDALNYVQEVLVRHAGRRSS